MNFTYETLSACAIADLCRRFKIIEGEIAHLIRSIGISKTDADANIQRQNISDDQAFLSRLAAAAYSIQEEIATQKIRVDQLHLIFQNKPSAVYPLSIGQLLSFEQAAFRGLANIIVERIGSLHDRLDQFLERSNPDHPGPTRRRRAEQGVQDKYLDELVKWIHRDLIRFASHDHYLGEGYPYQKPPSTFQIWDYEWSSRHHAFITSTGQEAWLNWYESGSKIKNACKVTGSEKFTALRLSYWMPECNELHPIIAHELAHQILRDIYGYEQGPGDLEVSGNGLSRTLRRVHQCVEAWTADSPTDQLGQLRPLPIELTCDAFALTRCGPSFVYAQFLEFLDNEALFDICKDHLGIVHSSLAGVSENSSKWIDRIRELAFRSENLRDRSVAWALRLYVTTQLIEKIFRPNKGTAEQAFIEEIQCFLDDTLLLYSGELNTISGASIENQYVKSIKAFGKDLVGALTSEGMLSKKTVFRKSAERFWSSDIDGNLENFFLYRQSLGRSWHEAFGNVLTNCGTALIPKRHLSTLDIPWLLSWKNATNWRQDERTNPIPVFSPNQINALDAARDVYLYRTTNPLNIAGALGIELTKESTGLVKEVEVVHWHDSQKNKILYWEWMQLIDQLRLPSGIEKFIERGFGLPNGLIKANATTEFKNKYKLADLKGTHNSLRFTFDSTPLIRWFDKERRYKFHLVSVPSKNKRATYSKYEDERTPSGVNHGIVLGRYDAFEIQGISHINVAHVVSESLTDHRRRSRNVIMTSRHNDRIGASSSQNGIGLVNLAIVLVSLQWTGLRFYSVGLIEDLAELYPLLKVDVCLSDGWEDLDIFISLNSQAGHRESIQQLIGFVEGLNQSSFVSSTETIFNKISLGIFDNDAEVDIEIQCRMSPHPGRFISRQEFKNAIAGMLANTRSSFTPAFQIRSQFGLLDYSIRLLPGPHGRSTEEFLSILYQLDSIDRIETHISL